MTNSKKLSNPFSTGGGGHNFEIHVLASYVTLLLTGGHVPGLPCWPITEVRLQRKIDNLNFDDFIVTVKNPNNKEQRRMIGQIKHSISITEGSQLFGEVIQAAWNDFADNSDYKQGKDIIALITGPLSKNDTEVFWLLNHARATQNDASRFFTDIETAIFCSNVMRQKLKAFIFHLKKANNGIELSKERIHEFLRNFYLFGYDLGEEEGVVLSLINSHISQFRPDSPRDIWSRIFVFTSNINHHAGCISKDNIPQDLMDDFFNKPFQSIPEKYVNPFLAINDLSQHSNATFLALATLIGSWDEKNQKDKEVLSRMLRITYDQWMKIAQEIVLLPNSPLLVKNGIWKIQNKIDVLNKLGYRLQDQNLEVFQSIILTVLKENNPSFDLPVNERFAATIFGKKTGYSTELRKGIAEGLAILGSNSKNCNNCSLQKVESLCILSIRNIFSDANWKLWGSLNDLLPILAEASPDEFLSSVDNALNYKPCPFDELFSQEGNGISGASYLTGLLWALEALAWDEKYLVRACMALGELADHDPGGILTNRPANSLINIFLPWLPQTFASFDKRKVAVETLLAELPNIAWDLLIQLLPDQRQTSSGTNKPKWRKTNSENVDIKITNQEYWQQVSYYAELAVFAIKNETIHLFELIEHFDKLPQSAFNQLLEILHSPNICSLPENKRLDIWESLRKLITKHKRFSDTNWALKNDSIDKLEKIANQLAPTNPLFLYKHLFTDHILELYEQNDNWDEQQKNLDEQRKLAIREILQQNKIDGVIKFVELVDSPFIVGQTLAIDADEIIEKSLLPVFLDVENNNLKTFISGFIIYHFKIRGWDWCDQIDKSTWNKEQIGYFLACLPFIKGAWDRATEWLEENQKDYWSRTGAVVYDTDDDLPIGIEKLIEYGRPHAAINCLIRIHYAKKPIKTDQCVRALLSTLSSNEPTYAIDVHSIILLIKLIQSDPKIIKEDELKIEWAYIQLLDNNHGAAPITLERELASNAEFFCEVIGSTYRSKDEIQKNREIPEEKRAIATNAWHLLDAWKIPPGTQDDDSFNFDSFEEWLITVIKLSQESGHLEVALTHIGEVLFYAPSDPDGLWIHKGIAKTLNKREYDDMRSGFETRVFNSRGVHWVDPTGKPELEFAEQYKNKAEEVENAGFQRFAVTLRRIAEDYEREAKRIIDVHSIEEN